MYVFFIMPSYTSATCRSNITFLTVQSHLEEMYSLLDKFLEDERMVLELESNTFVGESTKVKEHAMLFNKCLQMFDQDFVMKVSVHILLDPVTKAANLSSYSKLYKLYCLLLLVRFTRST
jgi:hypothetical protein